MPSTYKCLAIWKTFPEELIDLDCLPRHGEDTIYCRGGEIDWLANHGVAKMLSDEIFATHH